MMKRLILLAMVALLSSPAAFAQWGGFSRPYQQVYYNVDSTGFYIFPFTSNVILFPDASGLDLSAFSCTLPADSLAFSDTLDKPENIQAVDSLTHILSGGGLPTYQSAAVDYDSVFSQVDGATYDFGGGAPGLYALSNQFGLSAGNCDCRVSAVTAHVYSDSTVNDTTIDSKVMLLFTFIDNESTTLRDSLVFQVNPAGPRVNGWNSYTLSANSEGIISGYKPVPKSGWFATGDLVLNDQDSVHVTVASDHLAFMRINAVSFQVSYDCSNEPTYFLIYDRVNDELLVDTVETPLSTSLANSDQVITDPRRIIQVLDSLQIVLGPGDLFQISGGQGDFDIETARASVKAPTAGQLDIKDGRVRISDYGGGVYISVDSSGVIEIQTDNLLTISTAITGTDRTMTTTYDPIGNFKTAIYDISDDKEVLSTGMNLGSGPGNYDRVWSQVRYGPGDSTSNRMELDSLGFSVIMGITPSAAPSSSLAIDLSGLKFNPNQDTTVVHFLDLKLSPGDHYFLMPDEPDTATFEVKPELDTLKRTTGGTTVNWDVREVAMAVYIADSTSQIATPTSLEDGQVYTLVLQQDTAGGHEVSFTGDYVFNDGLGASVTNWTGGPDDFKVFTFRSNGQKLYDVGRDFDSFFAHRAPSYTTTQRDNLSPVAGDIIYNTTTSKHQGYDGTSWNDFY